MPVKNSKKPESELSQTYAAVRMRNLRAKRRLENEQKYLQENRVNSKHYNNKWSEIREAKPDYSNDPSYEELQKRKQEETEKQPEDETPIDDNNSNNDDDKSIDVSVKLPDIDDVLDDDMIDEALDEVEKELTKQQRKNKKRREQMKQLKKGNKITEATPINEDVD